MANAYTIISMQANYPQVGVITIIGTVNGVQVTTAPSYSAYLANAATAVGFENWVAPLLLAAYNQSIASQLIAVTPPVLAFSQ